MKVVIVTLLDTVTTGIHVAKSVLPQMVKQSNTEPVGIGFHARVTVFVVTVFVVETTTAA